MKQEFVYSVSYLIVCLSFVQHIVLHLSNSALDLSVPVSQESVTVSQHEHFYDPEIEADIWNLATIHFINFICAFAAVAHQNVLHEKCL